MASRPDLAEPTFRVMTPAWLPGTGFGVSAFALILRPLRYTRTTTFSPAMYGRRTPRTLNEWPLSVAALAPDPKTPLVVSASLPFAWTGAGAGVGVGTAGGGVGVGTTGTWADAWPGSASRARAASAGARRLMPPPRDERRPRRRRRPPGRRCPRRGPAGRRRAASSSGRR